MVVCDTFLCSFFAMWLWMEFMLRSRIVRKIQQAYTMYNSLETTKHGMLAIQEESRGVV